MNSIRHLKTCTSIAAVLVALAAASATSAADSTKLPSLAGGAFSFSGMGTGDLLPASALASGYRAAGPGHRNDLPSPEWVKSDEYKASWFLDKINAAPAYAMGYTGKGVLTAVLDSGIDTTHPEFAGRISTLSRSFHFASEPGDVSDVDEFGQIIGHGSMVSGIVGAARDGRGMTGVASGAEIMALRVDWSYREDGESASNDAIRYAAKNGAKVLNGSFGPIPFVLPWVYDVSGNRVPNPNYAVLPNSYVAAYGVKEEYEAVKAGAEADIVMVFAAGNEFGEQPLQAANPSGIGLYPLIRPENHGKGIYTIVVDAADPDDPSTLVTLAPDDPELVDVDFSDIEGTLITVVSTDRDNKIASYSNRCGAAWLWCLAAPGGDSPGPHQEEKDTKYTAPHPFGTYDWANGTSAAAPVVAGGTTVLREAFPYMTARQIIEVALTTATEIGPREIYGRGMFNLGRAVKGPYEFGAEGFARTFDVDTKGYDSTWSNDIRGTGGLIKRGEGNLLLTGANTYAGGTEVLGGILTLDGSLGSNLSIGSRATLRGTGSIDAPLSVAGTLDPGGAKGGTVGTLTVKGGAELLGTSTYKADVIVRSGEHDKLEVSGQTSLKGGSLAINVVDGAIPVNKPFDVLFSGEGVNGEFGKVTTNSVSAFLAPTLVYDADVVWVAFERNGVSFASAAQTRNQASVANAADRAGAGNAIHDLLAQNTLDATSGSLSSLTGEVHGSVATSAYGDAALIGNTLLGRLNKPLSANNGVPVQASFAADTAGQRADTIIYPTLDPKVFALWGEGFGSWGKAGSNGNAGSLNRSTGGFIIGAEAIIEKDYRVGIAGGFTSTDLDIGSRSSSATNESVFGAVYGSARWGAINARLGASFSVHDIDTTRSLTLPGAPGQATASYDGTTVQAFGELGYRFGLGKVELEPFVGASVLRLHTDGYVENGGIASLTGYGRTYDLATTTLGIRGETRLGTDLPLTIRGMLGWRHAYGDVSPTALMGLSGGASSFGVSGVPVDRDAFVAEANLDWQVSNAVTLGVSYQGQVGSKAQDHALKGSLTVRF